MKPRYQRLTEIAIIAIPILLVLYLLTTNFIIPQEFNYYYNIGGEENYLTPIDRISEKYNNQRDMMSHMIYFDVDVPRGSKEIKIETRLKPNLPTGENLRLGARDQEDWHYMWHTIYTQEEENNGGWQIISTTFKVKEENLKIENGKLSFVFYAQYLDKEEYKNYTIPIDYINVTIYKPGLIK
jgi:hypothetical protein